MSGKTLNLRGQNLRKIKTKIMPLLHTKTSDAGSVKKINKYNYEKCDANQPIWPEASSKLLIIIIEVILNEILNVILNVFFELWKMQCWLISSLFLKSALSRAFRSYQEISCLSYATRGLCPFVRRKNHKLYIYHYLGEPLVKLGVNKG